MISGRIEFARRPMTEQRWWRVIPVAFVMYTIAFVDRTNVSLALPAMSRDLHMNPTQAGAASGIFFIGYVLLQIPGGYLASRWSAKKLVSIMLVTWGVCSAGSGLIHTWRQLLAMRFLLGLAEAGVWPATLVILSRWFPPSERARGNAYWMLCLPIAVVVSSPVSGWILGRWGWRVLLVSEGLLPIIWLLPWTNQIYDHPGEAPWISAEERDFLQQELTEGGDGSSGRNRYWEWLFHPQVLLMTAISFLVSTGNYGYLFWLPTVLERSHHASGKMLDHATVGLLNALPYVVAAIGMILISRHSDRRRERAKYVAVALAWASVLLATSAVLSERSPELAFVLLCLVAGGSFGMLGPFWAIPSENLPAAVAGSAIGMIQFSNLGGAFGPTVIGYLQARTGHFTSALLILAAGWAIGAGLCLLLKRTATS